MQNTSLERYSRHINLHQFGYTKQKALNQAHALIIGLGGLGAPAALYLAASGVGRLTLVDGDRVELSNLPRQIAHTESFVAHSKVDSAAHACHARNHEIRIDTVEAQIDAHNAPELISSADVVLDCTDNLDSRLLIAKHCTHADTALVFAAANGFEGQLAVFAKPSAYPEAACLHCLYGTQALGESCKASGVLSPVVGLMGVYQALEAIKVITGLGSHSVNRLQLFDGLYGQWQTLGLKKQAQCPICGNST